MRLRSILHPVAVAVALAGCGNGKPLPPSSAALVPLEGCEQALDFVRQVALAKMNKQIDAQLAQFEQGQGCWAYGIEDAAAGGGPVRAPSPPSAPSGGATTSGAKAASASGTNNQVAGVDEADFVKNDGKYIYLAQNGVLRIVDAYPGAAAREVSKTPLDGTPRKLFVEGDRALVYVSVPDPRLQQPGANGGAKAAPSYGGGRECTYGYDCQFTGDGTSTKLEVFDLTNRAAPAKVREIFLSGSLIAARRIGGATHTVVSDNLQLFPEIEYYPQEDLCAWAYNDPNRWSQPAPQAPPQDAIDKARAAYEALRQKNAQVILTKDLSGVLPRLADSAVPGADLTAGAELCSGLYRAQLLDGASFTSLVSVDMTRSDPPVTASIVSSPGAVYASDRALYLAVPSEQGYGGVWYSGYAAVPQVSAIHKFALGAQPSATGYVGSGLIEGRVLNQFAMDEKDGYLRVASTTGHVPDPKVESQITVLADAQNALVTVGRLSHLAPTEDIRSVRFDGDRGFVVTFKKTDPLFVLDLRDPRAPKVDGELKIPGFSTYMHLLDQDHLLAIGYDADDHGSFAYFDGVLLQIFDISNPKAPVLAHKHVIGTRGSSSEALTNHLAFNYFAPLKLLAVPMTICEGGGDGTFGDQMTFSGLMLFDVDAQAGISEHGRVAHPVPTLASNPWGGPATCSTWWSQAGSDVKRSIFMDRFVYSISDEVLKVQSIDAMGADLQSLPLK